MKIVLIIYIVSWLILLGTYLSKRFSKKEKTVFLRGKREKKEKQKRTRCETGEIYAESFE